MIDDKKKKIERCVLVGLNCDGLRDFESSDDITMNELDELVKTAGGEAVMAFVQNRATPDPRTFIGEGKAMEIAEAIRANEIELAVFDNELSPSQTKALEEALACRVIDRNGLILDIFADRARTSEGKLQVELAQYQYLLPRLSGMWAHLVRQNASGGKSPIGTRGPGETQLETDRRHVRRKIQKLEREIDEVKRIRATQRKKRVENEAKLVCIVGYTNAGKSTLLNALTGADIQAKDRLFDTLDPTTRSMEMPDGRQVLISDTVGFIRNLPHHLVDAFRATLEELTYADVLVHVIDASDEQWEIQAEVVEKLIRELGASDTPRITVFNKVDKLPEAFLPRQTDAVFCSALKGMGLDSLMKKINDILNEGTKTVTFVLPYSDGHVLQTLYRDANVLRADYIAEGIEVEAVCDKKALGRIRQYLPESEWREKEPWEE
ncbi:MAG: GTPase HflX [Clostridia bacterium]|nr:GTPase HflX [Clostridia bacterium]MBQ2325948.1 GTPase HflX [Clostridia bacterium]MBQ5814115.1 GTPase HflX [Clostridia bacterium]